jgi:uncharacterized membrane protein
MKMPLFILVIMNVGIVAGAVIQWFGHMSFRPGVFFGATVDPEFSRTQDGQRILWRYRRPIIVVAALCIAALWLVVPRLKGVAAPLACSALIFIEVSAAIVSMAATSRHVRAFRKPPSPTRTRTASLLPRNRTLPGGWLAFAGPMLIVGAAWLLFYTRRALMPTETYRGALGLLLVPFVANVFSMSVAWLVVFRTRQINPEGPAASEESADRRTAYWFRMVGAYFMTVWMIAMALPLVGVTPPDPRYAVIPMAVLVLFATIVAAYLVTRSRRAPYTSGGAAMGDAFPDECRKLGFIYYNPDDPALVVETRLGRWGCDLNFGNKWSGLVSAVILGTPIVIRLLWF